MKQRKKLIFYCDDQPRFIDQFVKRHGSEFEIETTTKAEDAVACIEKLGKTPDLILLDLFHPQDTDEFEKNRVHAEDMLKQLNEKIAEVKPSIEKAWAPVGIDLLDEIRNTPELKDVPVLFYTQRGLLFISDEQLQEIYEKNSDFMLKEANSSIIAERARMRQVIRQKPGRIEKILRWVIPIGTFLGGLVAKDLAAIPIHAFLTKLGIL